MNALRDFLKDETAQVSAEMLILTAALVAVALLLVTQLQATAVEGKDVLSKQAENVFKQIKKMN
ncbi:Flp family type IVb pilin [Candidatus Micrarchaeota archaeon]|nr:Flp family type IVb pilin [Candidatus Micrarchaeota archaeon]